MTTPQTKTAGADLPRFRLTLDKTKPRGGRPPNLLVRRLMDRDGVSRATAFRRLKAKHKARLAKAAVRRGEIPRKPRRRKHTSALRIQYAALPYRFTPSAALEILLVTSRRSKRWIIPKGWPIKGLRPAKSAARGSLRGSRRHREGRNKISRSLQLRKVT
jgi:hypothetical protein